MSDANAPTIQPRRRWIRGAVVAVWALVILYAIGFDRGRSLLNVTKTLVDWSDQSSAVHAVVTAGVVGLGLLLFMLKRYGRARYGALEITFAAAVAWYALGEPSNPPEAVFAELLGACYVLVRGLENIEQGFASLRRVR